MFKITNIIQSSRKYSIDQNDLGNSDDNENENEGPEDDQDADADGDDQD